MNYSLLSILLWRDFFVKYTHWCEHTWGKASSPEAEVRWFGINFNSPSDAQNSLAGFFSWVQLMPPFFKYLFWHYVPFGSFGLTSVSWTSAVHHISCWNKSAADAELFEVAWTRAGCKEQQKDLARLNNWEIKPQMEFTVCRLNQHLPGKKILASHIRWKALKWSHWEGNGGISYISENIS